MALLNKVVKGHHGKEAPAEKVVGLISVLLSGSIVFWILMWDTFAKVAYFVFWTAALGVGVITDIIDFFSFGIFNIDEAPLAFVVVGLALNMAMTLVSIMVICAHALINLEPRKSMWMAFFVVAAASLLMPIPLILSVAHLGLMVPKKKKKPSQDNHQPHGNTSSSAHE